MIFALYPNGVLTIEDEEGIEETMLFYPEQTESLRDFLNENWSKLNG